jgi:6-phospho-beta-glucosidase
VPSYYLRYFYAHDEVVAEQRESGSRAARVAEIEQELLAMYADPTLDEKPALLMERGGAYYSEAAVHLTASLLGDPGDGPPQVVNLRNDGTLPFLPDDAVVEVPATVDRSGVRAVPVAPLAPLYAGLVAAVTAYEHLALDAALRGGYDRVFQALLAHPLVGQADLAHGLADRLIDHNRDHLPWA